VCYWEDDGQDDVDAQLVQGGPNRTLSLHDARKNYALLGAADPADVMHVRAPTDVER